MVTKSSAFLTAESHRSFMDNMQEMVTIFNGSANLHSKNYITYYYLT